MTYSDSAQAADAILEPTDDFYQDPHAVYRELRARGPIHRIRLDGVLGWLVVDHDVAKQAFLEPGISKKIGSPEGQAVLAQNGAVDQFNGAINDNMLFADPPQHTRLRKLGWRPPSRSTGCSTGFRSCPWTPSTGNRSGVRVC